MAMPDTAKIQPALTAEEWAEWRDEVRELGTDNALSQWGENCEAETVVAVANDALPDDDARKITSGDLDMLTSACWELEDSRKQAHADALRVLRDRLAALLPPEPHE